MEKELVFHILGIAETKDESVIKTAYMALLRQTNPEDDPDGFKRLREAYEEASALARKTDESDDDREKTEVDLWADRIRAVYEDIRLRDRRDKWAELLTDPVCEELDTATESRDQMLKFLMDHIYLPHDIWKMIDKTFHFVHDLESLKEEFPPNFLDYIKYYVENDGFIRYGLFRLEDPRIQNVDKYLEHYFAVKKKLDQEETSGCLEELDDLKAFGLYYPYEDVERIRTYLKTGQAGLADELGQQLLEAYPADNYVRVWCGEAFWASGKKEAAYGLWQEILAEYPLYYQAKMGCVRYQAEQGNYYQAREWLQELLDGNSQDQEAMDLLTSCNDHLIEEYTGRLERGEGNDNLSSRDMRIELGWCLFQNERIGDAIRTVEHFEPDEESRYDFNNLFGRLLYHDKQFDRARPYLEAWLKLIEETVDDGTDKMKKRISRKCRAMNILGSCLHELGENEAAQVYLRRAVEAAEVSGERLGTLNYLAHILQDMKQYEQAVDVCDMIIREDDGYYPAYLTRQEACFELKKGQEVVNDYHRAIDIYPGYHKPYLLAAEVFFYYGQYEDGKGVFDKARENQVEFSDRMKLFEVKILRNLANSKADREEPLRLIGELAGTVSEESDIEDLSEIEFETALLNWDNNHLDAALLHLKKAIEENPERMQYRMIRGHVYLDMSKYREALADYEAAETAYQDEPSLYYNRGLCYEELNRNDSAIENFEKTLELRETYRDACEKVMNHYKSRYESSCRKADLDRAVDCISRELKENESSYYLIERGRLHLNSFQLEPAIADFEKSLEYDADSWAAYNNIGCAYKYMGQYEKAIGYFEKAVGCMKDHKTVLPYSNMADCYEIMGDYHEAIRCYREDLKLFPDRISFWEDIGDLYTYLGDFREALKAYAKIKTEDRYYLCLANVAERRGQLLKARAYYLLGIWKSDDENRAKRWCDLADSAMIFNPARAERAYKKAISCCRDLDDIYWYEQKLSTHYYRQKQFDKARIYAEKALAHFKESGKNEDDYLAYQMYAPARFRILGLIYMGLGEKDICDRYFEQMDQVLRCWSCRDQGCHEKYYYRGIYREANGDLTGAMADYVRCKELCPSGYYVDCLVNMLRKKMDNKT